MNLVVVVFGFAAGTSSLAWGAVRYFMYASQGALILYEPNPFVAIAEFALSLAGIGAMLYLFVHALNPRRNINIGE